ncbi:deacetoxyvindoline 4-hydroxylase-like [Abrus precatorius]|uniref:Deacetoxyvindoline 4-hydroxylase-like n=1 Tax=Abrus precatorius TaxID=3816 RepID=A0A8B8LPE5_ABRPR|nr:deacetoxyvindoline 4-hydroxylase-like [Abrus precatorius]
MIRLASEVSSSEEYYQLVDDSINTLVGHIAKLRLQTEDNDKNRDDGVNKVANQGTQPKGFKQRPTIKRKGDNFMIRILQSLIKFDYEIAKTSFVSKLNIDIVTEYSKKVRALGVTIFELLSKALGLDPSYLKKMDCAETLFIMGQYYLACPELELTLGSTKHNDMDFMTILLQDQIGGLQILHDNHWINVASVHDALIINIGDLLQIL